MGTRFAGIAAAHIEELRYEPRPQRIRVLLDGDPVADTTAGYLVWEPRRFVPLYALPAEDFKVELTRREHLDPDLSSLPPRLPPGRFEAHSSPGHVVDVGGLAGAGYVPDDPDLAGRVLLDFRQFTWLEEEEEVVGHPRDPFKRIDVLPSSRHIQVSLEGTVLADTKNAMMLLETGLPVRWYIPRADVRLDILTPSEHRTTCAYKGHATYWSYEAAGEDGRDLCWTYNEPMHDAVPVKEYLCFWSERTDLTMDGEPVERPHSPFSPPPR